jgi:hypothetical protein
MILDQAQHPNLQVAQKYHATSVSSLSSCEVYVNSQPDIAAYPN